MTETEDLAPEPAVDQLRRIKAEITKVLQGKLEELQSESKKVHGLMEQILYRLSAQGVDAKMDDLRSGRWYRLATEARQLQEVLHIFEACE